MNNERRGVNCAHTWFLKQEEIKSQFSQWVFSGNGKALLPLATKKNPLSFSYWTSIFFSPSKKYIFRKKISFSEKQISFLEKQISFPEKQISSSFSYLFSLFFVLPTIFAAATFSLSSAPLDGLRDPPPESSSTCQSPTVASKSEVDFLRPLRMWHVARWDSENVTHVILSFRLRHPPTVISFRASPYRLFI